MESHTDGSCPEDDSDLAGLQNRAGESDGKGGGGNQRRKLVEAEATLETPSRAGLI